MSYRSRVAFRFFLEPLICVIAYFVIIFFSLQTVALLEGEDYLDHEGLIYLIEGVIGVTVCIIWWLIRKKYVLGTPTIAAGKPVDWTYAVVSALAMLGVAVLYFYSVKNLPVSAVQKSLENYSEMMQSKSTSNADLYMSVQDMQDAVDTTRSNLMEEFNLSEEDFEGALEQFSENLAKDFANSEAFVSI